MIKLNSKRSLSHRPNKPCKRCWTYGLNDCKAVIPILNTWNRLYGFKSLEEQKDKSWSMLIGSVAIKDLGVDFVPCFFQSQEASESP